MIFKGIFFIFIQYFENISQIMTIVHFRKLSQGFVEINILNINVQKIIP